jgi:hypothetical protein
MTRTRASAKSAGASFERLVADYLAHELDDDRIDRRVPTGAKDKGDITAVRTITGGRVVIEAKNYAGQIHVGPWLDEAEAERGNDDAQIGVVVAKRRGVGSAAGQVVFMTLEAFALLLQGGPTRRGEPMQAPEVQS